MGRELLTNSVNLVHQVNPKTSQSDYLFNSNFKLNHTELSKYKLVDFTNLKTTQLTNKSIDQFKKTKIIFFFVLILNSDILGHTLSIYINFEIQNLGPRHNRNALMSLFFFFSLILSLVGHFLDLD